jgi:integrase
MDGKVPMLVVSRILGHSSVAITADIYGHVLEDTAREAMESLGSRVAFGA